MKSKKFKYLLLGFVIFIALVISQFFHVEPVMETSPNGFTTVRIEVWLIRLYPEHSIWPDDPEAMEACLCMPGPYDLAGDWLVIKRTTWVSGSAPEENSCQDTCHARITREL